MRKWFLLLAILVIAGSLRLFQLTALPNGLYWDEYDTGYQSFSLLTTGRDYFGNPLPLFPHSLSDFRTPVYIYLTVPLVKIFGLTPFVVRFTSAVFGILSVFIIYYLARLIFHSKNIGLYAAFVLAVSPWHVLFSRISLDGLTPMLAFFMLGLILFFKSALHPRLLFLSGLFFSLSVASYSPAKFIVPLVVLFVVIYSFRRLRKVSLRYLAGFLLGLSILAGPIYYDALFGKSSTRFHDISVFSEPTLATYINRQRLDHQLSSGAPKQVGMRTSLYEKLLYNKVLHIGGTIFTNYLSTFSTQYLFISGDPQLRHSPSPVSQGQFLLADIIPFLIGGLYFFTHKKIFPLSTVLLVWFLLSPLPAALTREGGQHAGRTFFLLPVMVIVIALGLNYLYRRHRRIYPLFMVIYLFSTLLALDYFFTFYRFESAPVYNYGFGQISSFINKNTAAYDRIIVDAHEENALMSYLFTSAYPADQFSRLLPFKISTVVADVTAIQIGNVHFVTPGSRHWTDLLPKPEMKGRQLVVIAADLPLAETISASSTLPYPDGSPAYYFVETK